jgi:ATP-dependent Clp protease ATP-binding subunit ClpB
MLQIFDDGRLTDSKGRTVDFKNTLIILTSNIGSEIILKNTLESMIGENQAEETKTEVMSLMQQRFKPEFLNRIDDIVFFKALTMAQLAKIVDIQLSHLQTLLTEQDITLSMTNDAKEFLAQKGYNPIYGARPLKRTIRQLIENPLSKKILKQEITQHSKVNIDVNNDELTFTSN